MEEPESCQECKKERQELVRMGRSDLVAGAYTTYRDSFGNVTEWCCMKMATLDLTNAIRTAGPR